MFQILQTSFSITFSYSTVPTGPMSVKYLSICFGDFYADLLEPEDR